MSLSYGISTIQFCSVPIVNDINEIWRHLVDRLQDCNVLVLKKDVEIFLGIHLEVKFDF